VEPEEGNDGTYSVVKNYNANGKLESLTYGFTIERFYEL
jgi:hypothetical protein